MPCCAEHTWVVQVGPWNSSLACCAGSGTCRHTHSFPPSSTCTPAEVKGQTRTSLWARGIGWKDASQYSKKAAAVAVPPTINCYKQLLQSPSSKDARDSSGMDKPELAHLVCCVRSGICLQRRKHLAGSIYTGRCSSNKTPQACVMDDIRVRSRFS